MNLLGIFGLVALAELVVFVAVERRIGLVAALLVALATALLGSALVRRAGLSVLGRFREKLAGGTLPGRELTHGAAVLVAGALLISPGFLTDAIGFTLLVPGVRDAIHDRVANRLTARIVPPEGGPEGEGPPIIDVDSWEAR